MQCDYCAKLATARIPNAADQVCLLHAISFWKGLLACARAERRALKKSERLIDRTRDLARTAAAGPAHRGAGREWEGRLQDVGA